jgi:Phage tail tube protein
MPNESRFRISGMFGSAYRDGKLLADVVEVIAPVQLGRITVPAVGSADESYKQGRITREGTMRVDKYDSSWEMELYNVLSQSDDARRAARDSGNPLNPEFSLVLKLDDPEALGVERWQLDGVRCWNFQVGFSGGDEITEREYQITWTTERPLTTFLKSTDSQGRSRATYVVGGP